VIKRITLLIAAALMAVMMMAASAPMAFAAPLLRGIRITLSTKATLVRAVVAKHRNALAAKIHTIKAQPSR